MQYSTLSGYRVMWVWALFDLPVVSKDERSRATKFRNSLLDLGFEMVQFSVYSRYTVSKEKADSIASSIRELVPEYGKVDLLYFTDKQYELITSFRGEMSGQLPEKPTQFALF